MERGLDLLCASCSGETVACIHFLVVSGSYTAVTKGTYIRTLRLLQHAVITVLQQFPSSPVLVFPR